MSLSDISQLPRGAVVLVRFPFTNLEANKKRPAILLTDPSAVSGPDGHFVFIGSVLPAVDERFIVIESGSKEAVAMGLKKTSYVNPRKIATLAVSLCIRRLGQTPPDRLRELGLLVAQTLGLNE